MGESFELVVVEDDRGTLFAESRPLGADLFGRDGAVDFLPQGRNPGQCVAVARFDDRVGAVEIEHADIDGPVDHQAASFGHVVVGLVHGQREGLIDERTVLRDVVVSRRAFAADQEIGMELLVEGFPGEVVVDAAVVE